MTISQTILLIEDHPDFQTLIRGALPHHRVLGALNAEEGLRILKQNPIDLVLLDLNLPDKNGLHLLSELRNQPEKAAVPVMCITGESGIQEKITAFELGAEDYIVKPFDLLEFKARVEAKLRKTVAPLPAIRLGSLRIDPESHQVMIEQAGATADAGLTQTEFKLLSLFAKNPGKAFSRAEILKSVWGQSIAVSDRVIDVHLCSLRKKVKGARIMIQSIAGTGYRLTESPEENPDRGAPERIP